MLNKLFDLRFVIGVFFVLVAVLLLVYGLVGNEPGEEARSINLGTGGVFLAFGLLMLALSSVKEKPHEQEPEHLND